MNQELIRMIINERQWSWSIIGLVVIIIGLSVRMFFLTDVLHVMKIRNRSWYKRTLTYYQKKSILGWFFFACFVLGVIFLWRFEAFFLKYLNFLEWMLIFISVFFLSLFFHMRAYARSIVEALLENVELDKEL